MSTMVICMVLAAMVICSMKGCIARLSGCCGSGQTYISKVKVRDHNRSHYPYYSLLKVEGMSCSNCAVSVENALNSIDGVWAKVNLMRGEAILYMKHEVEEGALRAAVRDAGYGICGSWKIDITHMEKEN